MVLPCAEWWCDIDNQATRFGYCPSMVLLHVWPHCMNAICNRDHQDVLILFLLLLVCHAPLGVIAPNADISLQSGRFWATVIPSSSERLFDFMSCWIVFIHVVRGRPCGLLQSSEGEAVMILLASVSSGILAIWPNRERRRAWTIADRCGCPHTTWMKLSSWTWNSITYPWMKQSVWLRIIYSGDWCLRLMLCTSGACQKWIHEWYSYTHVCCVTCD